MKFKIEVDSKEIQELAQQYPIIAKAVIKNKVHEALEHARDRMIPYTPVSSGKRSKASEKYGRLKDGYNIAEYEPGNNVYGLIANNVWYGKIVEYGRKPGIAKKTWRVYSGLPASHFFEKGIERVKGGIESILQEIPDEIISEVG